MSNAFCIAFFNADEKADFSNGKFSSCNSMNVDFTSVLASPTPLYSLPSIVITKVTTVFFLFLSNGPNDIPVEGASILSINTETGLPSSQIVLLTDNNNKLKYVILRAY